MSRHRKGFTLIELLIVVVVIGILATMVMAKYSQVRQTAYYSTLKADLNNLRGAQEVYFQGGNFRYSGSLADLEFKPSRGVTVTTLTSLNNGQAWEAVALHSGLATGACVIGFGERGAAAWSASAGTPVVAVTDVNAGAPVCND